MCQAFGKRFVYMIPFNPYKIPAKYAHIIIDVEIEAIKAVSQHHTTVSVELNPDFWSEECMFLLPPAVYPTMPRATPRLKRIDALSSLIPYYFICVFYIIVIQC